MRFFFRISQSQKDLASAPLEKQLNAVSNSPSVEQPSLTSAISQFPSHVSRLSEISSPKVDNDEKEKRPLAHIRAPDTLIKTAATTTFTQAPANKTTTPEVQSHTVTTATTSATQPSPAVAAKSAEALPAPVQMNSVPPAATPCDTSCSKLPQTNLPETSEQNSTRFETITKTPLVSKPTSPLTPDITKEVTQASAMSNLSSRTPLQSSAAVSNDLTQQQTLSVSGNKNCQQPAPPLITKLPSLVADNKIPTELPTSSTAAQELRQAPDAKTTAHPSSTYSTQPTSQSSPIGEMNLTKSDQALSSDVSNNTKTKPLSSSSSLPAGPVNAAHKVVPEQDQPSETFTDKCKQTELVDRKESLLTEVNSITDRDPDTTEKVSPDTAGTSQPVLGKSGQQRTQMFAINSSISKVTPETANNKTHINTSKRPSSKDAKLPHVSHKVTDKHSTHGLNFRKDKLEDSDKKGFGKESSNNTSESEKRQEKQITSPKNTPLSSNNSNNKCNNNNNNNNKAPQQSPQVMKNNQQILKKNDEITRCANTVKRTAQITQRKPQDIMKTFSVQHRGQEDKSSTKKRCVLATNPAKRLLVKPVDASEHNDLEPVAKKWRLGTENNHKVIHADQKSSQIKDKCISNSNECHTSKTVTEKPNVSEVAPVVSKTNRSHFQSLAPVEKTERQNNYKVHRNSLADKAQSYLPAQRPAQNSQPSGLAKNYDIQSRTPVPKSEMSSPKRDVTTPQVSVSSACNRIAQNPSVPVPAAAHSNANHRSQHPSLKRKLDGESGNVGALDLSASPRRQQQNAIVSIAQTLARRHQQQCPTPSPAPPPLSPLSPLSPFPVMSLPVRSPPPQLRIPVPHYRSGHPQQQRPSSLSSSSPSPPADLLPGCSRPGLQQQPQPLDIYPSHMLPPTAVMYRQQLEMQRLWNSGKHNPTPCVEWFNDAKSIKSFENFMKNLQQQQGNRNASFFPYSNATSATNNHRK